VPDDPEEPTMTEGLIEPTDVAADELEAELDAVTDPGVASHDELPDDAATTVAVTGKVDDIISRISGQRLVDGAWLSDQLLDVSNLAPLSEVAGRAFAVVGELHGRTLVDRTWAVDQLLDLRTFANDRRN
jgi:hypothetical protein